MHSGHLVVGGMLLLAISIWTAAIYLAFNETPINNIVITKRETKQLVLLTVEHGTCEITKLKESEMILCTETKKE